MGLTLVLGGARSGKSAHAEALARASGLPVRYVATADPGDRSMAARIDAHVARRPADWETVVAGEALAACAHAPGAAVLVDGLGGWIASAMERIGDGDGWAAARLHVLAQARELARAAARTDEPVIVVAEQAGEGMLPLDGLARAWLDLLGEATQALAAHAERALLVVAGRAVELPAAESSLAPAGAMPAVVSPPVAVGDEQPAESAPALVVTAPTVEPPPAPAGTEPVADAEPAADAIAALRRHGDTLVRPGDADHAVNVLAGGPPPWLREALERALADDVAAYPREDEAVAALAALHGRAPREVVVTNGAAQALWLLPAALRPRLAACVHPGFTETEAALHAHGVPVARVLRRAEEGFALDPAAVPEDADLVVVGNPASPSGTLDPATALLKLRRPGRTLVVDEAFMDLVPGEPESLVRERLDDVIVVRSMTKSLAVPGVRAGYAVTVAPLAARLRAVRPPWSCNALALAALRALAERPQALADAAARAQAERADLERRLAAIDGLQTWPATANYVLVRVADGAAVARRLRERAIAVRPAGTFPGLTDDDLRITARDPQANARLADALAQAVAA